MRSSRRVFVPLILTLFAVFSVFSPAEATAQSAASISGVVKDSGGGVLPGATVTVKSVATGQTTQVVTNSDGVYQVPALSAGAYDVAASLTGFKTVEAKDIRVAPGQPVNIPLTLQIGNLTETVEVTSSAELINTQTATVASTLNADQITRMPTPTRNALNAVTFLPGVNTPGTNRDSTINGLPEGFLSITLDGVNNNDNFNRNTDGFFASITPRQDAVEAVTVTLAAAGAQTGGGAGAVTMAFETRSGTSRYKGTVYEYYRDPKMNTNYYFNVVNNLVKNPVKLHTFGGNFGGPIPIGGQRNKAFFFAHYEQIRFPNSFTRTRTVFNPRVYDGWFRYQFGTEVREVNLLQLAAANGQISQKDPQMTSIMMMIDAATKTQGRRSAQNDPLYDDYVWQSPATLFEHQPTLRVDYNLTANNRLSGTFSTITAKRTPDYLNNADPRFPGAPNQRDFVSERPLVSMTMRSVITPNFVNELRGGLTATWGASNFGYTSAIESSNGPKTFADQGGFAIVTAGNTTDWHTSNTPSWRSAPTYNLEDTVTWQKKSHAFTFGGNLLITNASSDGQQMVRGITLGFNTDFDPANGMFTTANFPGASSTNLAAARATYANLTGRVASVNSVAVLDAATGKYVELAPTVLPGGFKVFGSFVQDTWRVKPNLTLTYGLRWDLQTPFAPHSSVMSSVTMGSVCGMSGEGPGGIYDKCNFLKPGPAAANAVPSQFVQLQQGTEGYKNDWNNFAPSASIAWRPNAQSGILRTVFGDPDQATFRAGFSVAYERQGLAAFTGLYGGNTGGSLSLTKNANLGLVPAGESWPVLLSQTNRLSPASFNENPAYPIAVRANRADSLNAFAPDIQIARVRNWTAGFARSVSKDTAVEIRYVGNRGDNQWSATNYNTIRTENLLANGFMDEFKLAMGNLQANNASGVTGRVGSFAYFGAGTGTVPLPIFLAYFSGRNDVTNSAAYTNASTTWANSTIAGRLAAPSPCPTCAAGDLDGNLTRRNQAAALGYPANFFVTNPAVNNNNVTDSGAFSDYHAMQVEMRRRLSHGLSANVNYQYAFSEGGSAFDGFSFGRVLTPTANVRHAIKTQVDWTLPWGRGDSKLLNGLTGGWSVNMVGRFQTVQQNFGNVRLVGMTLDEFQDMYTYTVKPNATTGVNEVWMLPEDVILNTRRAFSTVNTTRDGYSTSLGAPTGKYLAPASSADCIQIRPGDCAPRSVMILAPWFKRVDLGATKRFDIGGSRNVEIRFDVLNLFDVPNFNPVTEPAASAGGYASATFSRTTTGYTDPNNTYDPGGRIGQLMFRLNF